MLFQDGEMKRQMDDKKKNLCESLAKGKIFFALNVWECVMAQYVYR